MFFHFYFLNMDISIAIHDFELKLSVCHPNILVGEGVSHNYDLGPSSHFMSKNG